MDILDQINESDARQQKSIDDLLNEKNQDDLKKLENINVNTQKEEIKKEKRKYVRKNINQIPKEEIKNTIKQAEELSPADLGDLTPVCCMAVQVPFEIASSITKCNLSLDEIESETLGKQLNEVLKVYLPQINKKEMVLYTFATSLLLIGFGKYQKYRAEKENIECTQTQA